MTLGGDRLTDEGASTGKDMANLPAQEEQARRIRVLLVDDHPLFRAGVRQRLYEDDPNLEVVGEAGSSRQAQEMVALLAPDVVPMDIPMGDGSGNEATRARKIHTPPAAVSPGACVGPAGGRAGPPSASTGLVKLPPLAGAELNTGPTEVALEFDEPVNSTFATVVVSTAGGVSVTRGKPAVLGARVRQRLSPSMTSGVYRVAYRVVSNDGHPVSGESSFTLTLAPTAGSATPRSSSAVSSSSSQPTSAVAATEGRPPTSPPPGQRGLPNRLLLPISGALALLASGGGVFLWRRRSR